MLGQGRFILAALALAGLGTLCPAQADEMIETRIVMHVTSLQTQDVGDVEGHVVGLIPGLFNALCSSSYRSGLRGLRGQRHSDPGRWCRID